MGRTLIASYGRKDFRVDTFAAGGPGGQHQNKTESAVRITHLPSGLAVECREHRSQHQNKSVAFRRLGLKVRDWHRAMADPRGVARNPAVVRHYHAVDNRVKDVASGESWSYRETVERGDLSGPILAAQQAHYDERPR